MAWWPWSVLLGIITLSMLLRRRLRNSRKCPSPDLMKGKTVVITGANSGIGKAAATELAKRKARVILACRTLSSAEQTAKELRAITLNSEVVPYEIDLGSFHSIRRFADQLLDNESKIDVLVNNAGVYAGPYMTTQDGLEVQMGVNHFGHFLLTSLLIDRIKESAPSRIIVVSSALSKKGSINFEDINCLNNYKPHKGYSDSKLANLLFTRTLSEKLSQADVDVFALHPGLVVTSLGRHLMSKFVRTLLSPLALALGVRDADEGCQPIVYCCVTPGLKGMSGQYFGKLCNKDEYPPAALDNDTAQKLWQLSEKITQTSF